MKQKSIKDVFAHQYNYYMTLRGKTRQDIVRDLGFKYTTIRDWETGTTIPRMDKVEKLAQYFGCNNSDLLEEPKETEKPTVGEDDGLSEVKRTLHTYVDTISEEEAALFLKILKSIVEPQA